MRVISCRPPSHPSLPEAEGAEKVKGGSGGGKGQGHTGGREGSEVKLGYPQSLHWSSKGPQRGLPDTHKHTQSAHTPLPTSNKVFH